MSVETTTEAIEAYAAAVASHLGDLSEPDRSDLLEDLVGHLVEVDAEEDGTLEDRLGSPAAYAEELRATAGLGPAPAPRRSLPRPALPAGLHRRMERFRAHPEVEASVRGLRHARPAWWVLRGYLAVLVLHVLVGQPILGLTSFPLPRLAGSTLFGLVAVGGACMGSVWLGRRSDTGWERRASITGNSLLGFLVLVLAASVNSAADGAVQGWWSPDDEIADDTWMSGSLITSDGTVITNLFPFGPDGEPLERIRLYDQWGQPVEIVAEWVHGEEVVTSYVLDADGRPVTHAFPQYQAPRSRDDEVPTGPGIGGPPALEVPPLDLDAEPAERRGSDTQDAPASDAPASDVEGDLPPGDEPAPVPDGRSSDIE